MGLDLENEAYADGYLQEGARDGGDGSVSDLP